MKLSEPKRHSIRRMISETVELEHQLYTAILRERTRADIPENVHLTRILEEAKESVGVARAALVDLLRR